MNRPTAAWWIPLIQLGVLCALLISGWPLEAAVKVRYYPFGEADRGATLGENALITEDIMEPPTEASDGAPVADAAGDFVPLEAITGEAPIYAVGRLGDGFSLEFDGNSTFLESAAFDPRNFATFAALSQAWVRPTSSGEGVMQAVWGLGNDNGGVGITADGTWLMRASSSIPDSDSGFEVAFDEWSHVAIFRDGNSASLYINGELAVRRAGTWNGPGQVVVGAAPGGDIPYAGQLDDFNIAGFSDFVFDPLLDLDFFDPENFSGVEGDIDQDGDVDGDDYLVWSANVGFDNGQGAGDAISLLRGDVDGNGRVNYFDFQIISDIAAQNGAPLNLDVLVPEPGSLVLTAIGLAFVGGWRQRRRCSQSH